MEDANEEELLEEKGLSALREARVRIAEAIDTKPEDVDSYLAASDIEESLWNELTEEEKQVIFLQWLYKMADQM